MVSSWSLLQRHQVRDDVLQLLGGQLHVRHEVSRLELLRVPHPGPEVLWGIIDNAGCECGTAHQVRQVRTKCPVGDGLTYRVTVHTGGRLEQVTTSVHGRVVHRWLLLRRHPARDVLPPLHHHTEQHIRALPPTLLTALAKLQPWFVGLDPHLTAPTGDDTR